MLTPEASTVETEVRPVRVGSSVGASWRTLKGWIKAPFYTLYERRLSHQVADWKLPRHIGVIMDGNRRFARSAGLPSVSQGHLQGAEKLWDVLSWCYDTGVDTVTVWSFSLDNFNRDDKEVRSLLELFETKTRELAEHTEVHGKQVRVRYIGEIGLLPESLQDAIRTAEEATASYDRYRLNIAMAYGGREEITEAFRRFLRDRASTGDSIEEITNELDADTIGRYLYTSGQPEPDLILRTSGEIRLSGFLLWQSAYSEYYFSDANWPALRRIDFLRALRAYNDRQRRFGR